MSTSITSVSTNPPRSSTKSEGYQPKVEEYTEFGSPYDEEKDKCEGEGEEAEAEVEDFGNLEFMTEQELIDYGNELESSLRYLQLENDILTQYLENHYPTSLDGLEQKVKLATSIAIKTQTESKKAIKDMEESESQSSEDDEKQPSPSDSVPSIINIVKGKGPKVNLSTKIDMVVKIMEQQQSMLDDFIKKAVRVKRTLKSELEEFIIRESDLKYSKNQFEFNVIVSGVEEITGRIPAEKWIRYMFEWSKSTMLAMEKLRLRIYALKNNFRKLTKTFVQRRELGANVHAVDFDQLEIANKHLLIKIDQKQNHVIKLKKMNGSANLILSKHKKYLLQQLNEYNKLVQNIEAKEDQIMKLDEEYVKVEKERDDAKEKFDYLKQFRDTYRVPDVMEYVVLKKEIDEINKAIKIWQRRKTIQEISLNATLREIKHLTGSTMVDPAWMEEKEDIDPDFVFNI